MTGIGIATAPLKRDKLQRRPNEAMDARALPPHCRLRYRYRPYGDVRFIPRGELDSDRIGARI